MYKSQLRKRLHGRSPHPRPKRALPMGTHTPSGARSGCVSSRLQIQVVATLAIDLGWNMCVDPPQPSCALRYWQVVACTEHPPVDSSTYDRPVRLRCGALSPQCLWASCIWSHSASWIQSAQTLCTIQCHPGPRTMAYTGTTHSDGQWMELFDADAEERVRDTPSTVPSTRERMEPAPLHQQTSFGPHASHP